MAGEATRLRAVPQDAFERLAHPDQVSKTVDAIASTPVGQRLERISAAAVARLGLRTAILHDRIIGRATELAGHRDAPYRRLQLAGTKPLTGEDEEQLAEQAPDDLILYLLPLLAELARRAPDQLAAALGRIAPMVGHALVPLEGRPEDLCNIAGDLGAQLSRGAGALLSALRDRQIDESERDAINLDVVPAIEHMLAAWKASQPARRPRRTLVSEATVNEVTARWPGVSQADGDGGVDA